MAVRTQHCCVPARLFFTGVGWTDGRSPNGQTLARSRALHTSPPAKPSLSPDVIFVIPHRCAVRWVTFAEMAGIHFTRVKAIWHGFNQRHSRWPHHSCAAATQFSAVVFPHCRCKMQQLYEHLWLGSSRIFPLECSAVSLQRSASWPYAKLPPPLATVATPVKHSYPSAQI